MALAHWPVRLPWPGSPQGQQPAEKCVSPEGQVLGETRAAWLRPEASASLSVPEAGTPSSTGISSAWFSKRGVVCSARCSPAAEGPSPAPSEHATGPVCFRDRSGPHLLSQACVLENHTLLPREHSLPNLLEGRPLIITGTQELLPGAGLLTAAASSLGAAAGLSASARPVGGPSCPSQARPAS